MTNLDDLERKLEAAGVADAVCRRLVHQARRCAEARRAAFIATLAEYRAFRALEAGAVFHRPKKARDFGKRMPAVASATDGAAPAPRFSLQPRFGQGAAPAPPARQRGGQPGNRNARRHGRCTAEAAMAREHARYHQRDAAASLALSKRLGRHALHIVAASRAEKAACAAVVSWVRAALARLADRIAPEPVSRLTAAVSIVGAGPSNAPGHITTKGKRYGVQTPGPQRNCGLDHLHGNDDLR